MGYRRSYVLLAVADTKATLLQFESGLGTFEGNVSVWRAEGPDDSPNGAWRGVFHGTALHSVEGWFLNTESAPFRILRAVECWELNPGGPACYHFASTQGRLIRESFDIRDPHAESTADYTLPANFGTWTILGRPA